jgi:hypothetical protein
MLGVVHEAELLRLDILLQIWVIFESYSFTFDFLAPAILVEALAEEDNVGQDDSVVELVDSIGHPVQIQGKDLVHKHFLSVSGA